MTGGTPLAPIEDAPTESFVKRRGVSRIPLLVVAMVGISALAFWPATNAEPADDEAAAGVAAPLPDGEGESIALSEPLPFDLRGMVVVMQTPDGDIGMWIDEDGSIHDTSFGELRVTPDATGRHFAAVDGNGLLWAGHHNSLDVVDTAVTGFEWHDTEPGKLIYSTVSPSGEPEIVRWQHARRSTNPETESDQARDQRVLVGSQPGQPAWFGVAGYALTDARHRTLVVTRPATSGRVPELHDFPFGQVLGANPEGDAFYAGEFGSMVISASSGETSVPDYLKSRTVVEAVRNPERAVTALLTSSSAQNRVLLIIGPAGESSAAESVPGASSIAWSRDGETLGFIQDNRDRQLNVGPVDWCGHQMAPMFVDVPSRRTPQIHPAAVMGLTVRSMAASIWKPIGQGKWVGSDPSVRFDVYTRGNAGEVYPEVFTPLSFSLASEAGEQAMRNALLTSGLIRPEEMDGLPLSTAVGSGVFGGYAYLNLSALRLVSARAPGGKASDADVNFLGVGTPPPHRQTDDERNLRATLAGLRYVIGLLRKPDLSQLRSDQARVDAYLAALPDPQAASDIRTPGCGTKHHSHLRRSVRDPPYGQLRVGHSVEHPVQFVRDPTQG